MGGGRDAELLEVLPVEAPRQARAGRRPHRGTSVVARAAVAGLVVGLGISLAIAGAEGGDASPAAARVPNGVGDVGDVVRSLDGARVRGPRRVLTERHSDCFAAVAIRSGGVQAPVRRGARVLDADVWALASSDHLQVGDLGPREPSAVPVHGGTPSVRVRILIGKGSTERLVPEQSHDYLRLVTRMIFTAPLDGLFARPSSS